MNNLTNRKTFRWPLISGLLVGLLSMLLTVGLMMAEPVQAAPLPQSDQPQPTPSGQAGSVSLEAKACLSCHPDTTQSWSESAHAHAYDDSTFQERWQAMGSPGDCLVCHTTNYQATNGHFSAEGVSCESCHGKVDQNHPLTPASIQADTEYCGTCHTTTLAEWRLTGHATAGVDCTDCHDPHSQKALFENPDDMCVNCHQDAMSPYLEDTHSQKGIGCVDCHALVIPPEVPPQDGIVPTGHTFTITPATCVACHTDALHAGFSLPGYEAGAKAASLTISNTQQSEAPAAIHSTTVQTPQEQIQNLQNQVETLQATTASRTMTVLFQGGVVGLVFGGSTAWIVANNIRRGRKQQEEEEEEEEKGQEDG